jgi:hypothetical protein
MPKKVVRELWKAKHVSVNCYMNETVDRKCGGPLMLGFDFTVDEDWEDADIRKFIRAELAKANIPLDGNILISKMEAKRLWTREEIAECIEKDEMRLAQNAHRRHHW